MEEITGAAVLAATAAAVRCIYRIIRMTAPPPIDNTPAYKSTPGGIFIVLFLHHHFITGGALNTTPPSEVICLKTAFNSKAITPGARCTPFIHDTDRYGYHYHHGNNSCAPSQQWADRACGPDPTATCCCRASSEHHVIFFQVHPAYRHWFSTPAVAQAPTITAAASETPATTLTPPLVSTSPVTPPPCYHTPCDLACWVFSQSLSNLTGCTPPRYHTLCHLASLCALVS